MADALITGLGALTTPASGDLLAIVDVSDTTMAATGTDKKMTIAYLFGVVPVNIVQADALNIQTDKVRARDGDGLYLVDDGDNGLFIEDGGIAYLGAYVTNAKMTLGLTIQQGAADDEILALKSSDVAHGVTDRAETDTYGALSKIGAADGGLDILALVDVGSVGFRTRAIAPTDDTTKSAAGVAYLSLYAQKTSGTGVTTPGADANLCAIISGTATRFIFDAEGEMHSDAIIGVGDDWDEWDDLALASDLSRLPKAKFDEMMKYKAEDFERAGLLTLSTDKDGNRHAFIRHKAMLQFAMCCFAEVAQRMKKYEQALLGLGVNPKLLEA